MSLIEMVMELCCARNVNPILMQPDSQARQCRRRKAAIKSRNMRSVSREYPQLLVTPWQVLGDTEEDGNQLSSHSSSTKAQYTETSDYSLLVPACNR